MWILVKRERVNRRDPIVGNSMRFLRKEKEVENETSRFNLNKSMYDFSLYQLVCVAIAKVHTICWRLPWIRLDFLHKIKPAKLVLDLTCLNRL